MFKELVTLSLDHQGKINMKNVNKVGSTTPTNGLVCFSKSRSCANMNKFDSLNSNFATAWKQTAMGQDSDAQLRPCSWILMLRAHSQCCHDSDDDRSCDSQCDVIDCLR